MLDDHKPSVTLSTGEHRRMDLILGKCEQMLTNRRRVVSPASHSSPHSTSVWSRFPPSSLPPRLLISSVHPLSSYHHDFPFSASRNTVKETRTGDLPRTYDAICGMSSCLFRPFVYNFLPLPSLSSLFRPPIPRPPPIFRPGENAWLTRGSIVSPLPSFPLFPPLGVSFFG